MRICLSLVIACCATYASALEGFVTRANTGEPLAGARIVARAAGTAAIAATADAEGKFQLTGLRSLRQYELMVSAEGCATALVPVPRGPSTPLRIALQREGVLEGRVVEAASSTAVVGATVEIVRGTIGVARAVTDASGAFHVGGLGNEKLQLAAWGDGMFMRGKQRINAQSKIGQTASVGRLQLERGFPAALTAVDARTGAGVVGARLLLLDPPAGLPEEMEIASATPLSATFPASGITMIASASGYMEEKVLLSPAEGGRAATVEIALRPLMRFAGRVVEEESGTGVPGVVLSFGRSVRDCPYECRSASDGAMQVAGVRPGRYAAFVRYATDAPLRGRPLPTTHNLPQLDFQNHDIGDYTVKLPPGVLLSGRVIDDATGGPIAGAEVYVNPVEHTYARYGSQESSTESGDDGRFELPVLAALRRGEVTALKAGYANAVTQIEFESGQSVEGIELRLTQGRAISGRVVDSASRPFVGAEVRVLLERPYFHYVLDVYERKTDAQGEFRFEHLRPGPWSVRVLPPGSEGPMGSLSVEPKIVPVTLTAEADVSGLLLALDTTVYDAALRGTVLDAKGKPVAGARVRADCTRSNEPRGGIVIAGGPSAAKSSVRSDAQGRFELTALARGSYSVTVSDASGLTRPFTVKEVPVPQEDFIIRLPETGQVSGRVVGLRDQAVEHFRARLIEGAQARWNFADNQLTAFEGGGFQFDDVAPGSYRVFVRAAGYLDRRSEAVEVKAGETTQDVVIHLSGGGNVVVKVQDPSGRPLEGARVLAGDETDDVANRPKVGGHSTNAEGVVTLKSLSPGPMDLAVIHDQYAPWKGSVDVKDNETTTMEVRLVAGGAIEARVLSADGAAVVDAYVRAWSEQASVGRQHSVAVHGGNGLYRLEKLPPGTYLVWMSLAKGDSEATRTGQMREVGVGDGATARVQFNLGGGRIFGVVTANGAPAAGYAVILRQSGVINDSHSSHTNGEGRYEFLDVPPGAIELSMIKSPGLMDDVLRTVSLTMGENQEREVNFTVPQGRIAGVALNAADRKPVTNGRAWLMRADDPSNQACFSELTDGTLDREGRFVLKGLPPGGYVVTILAPGYAMGRQEVNLGEGETRDDVRIEMDTGGALAGQLRHAGADPGPDDYAGVEIVDAAGGAVGHVKADAVGRYHADHVPEGECWVYAHWQGLGSRIVPARVRAGETTTLDVDLTAAVFVDLAYVDAQGQPLQSVAMRGLKIRGASGPFVTGYRVAGRSETLELACERFEVSIVPYDAQKYRSTTIALDLSGKKPGEHVVERVTLEPAEEKGAL